MGRYGIDNGWIQFNHVRVPRTNMLMRYSKVSREGEFTQPPIAQVSYGALLGGRVSIITSAALVAQKAVTIAVCLFAPLLPCIATFCGIAVICSEHQRWFFFSPQQVRYGVVRRQFQASRPIGVAEPVPKIALAEEQPILDYATHLYRLMPIIAEAYALHFTGINISEQLNQVWLPWYCDANEMTDHFNNVLIII